jgi:hypothetical protein
MNSTELDRKCSFGFDGNFISIKMIGNFKSGSKIFELDASNIMVGPDAQEGSNYDKVIELNSMA